MASKHIDYKAVYVDYIECKLSLEQIAKKHHVNGSYIELLVKNFAENEIGDLTQYNEALIKRKKLKKEQQKKDKKEQEKKDRELMERSKIEEATNALNEFLKSDLNEISFCVQESMSVKYFEGLLQEIKNEDSRLYKSVIAKFKSDELLEKQKYDELKLSEKEQKELEQANDIVYSFLKSDYDKANFLKNNSVSKKYFNQALKLISDKKPELYKLAKEKLSKDLVKESVILRKIIKNISDMVANGISNNDGTYRNFNMLDYYKKTNISFDRLTKLSYELDMFKENDILKNYEAKNLKNIAQISLSEMISKDKENELKIQKIFDYLNSNDLPYVYGVYLEVEKKLYDKKDISPIDKTVKMDELLETEFKQKEENEDIIEVSMKIVKAGIDREEKVQNIS